jgi:hypothetical protein
MGKGKNRVKAVPSSGNVFADLPRPNAEEKKTKVHLAVAINELILGQTTHLGYGRSGWPTAPQRYSQKPIATAFASVSNVCCISTTPAKKARAVGAA